MSAMSNLHLTITDRLEQGDNPENIAYDLEIPVSWVYEVFSDLTADGTS
jgi:hypothetical protein